MSRFTVFGLQRSGTNFLEQLVKQNIKKIELQNRWVKGGIWKHAYDIEAKPTNGKTAGDRGDAKKAAELGKSYKSAYIVKHPYSWIQSIYRKPVDIKKTYSFVVKEDDKFDLLKLAELYRQHTSYWMDKIHKEGRQITLILYEDLIKSPDSTKNHVRKIADECGMELVNPNKITIPDKVGQSDKFNENRRNLYVNYVIDTLKFEHIQKINKVLLDTGGSFWYYNEEYFGYPLIETQEEFDNRKQ